MSAGIGGEEEPKVHEVYEYEVQIVQRLLLNGEDIIDKMEEEGTRSWQIWE
ncbi:7259_t:CDS:2, partial [Paraglomus occultum]